MKFVLILLLVYITFRFVFRVFLPQLVKRRLEDLQQRMKDQEQGAEGSRVIRGEPSESVIDADEGDYIDYEDIN